MWAMMIQLTLVLLTLVTTDMTQIERLAEEIAWLDTDQLWNLATYLVDHYKVPANMLKADLEFAEQDLHFKD